LVPPFLSVLSQRGGVDRSTVQTVLAITRSLGFDNFMYGATAALKPNREANSYVFTTMPAQWIRRYDEMAYIEVDPRIEAVWRSAVPLVWDQRTFRGLSRRCDEFLADSARHGLGSGVCFIIHLPGECHVFVSLSSALSTLDNVCRQSIARAIPDILAFGHYFHEVFMRATIESNLPPRAEGAALSTRERQCLAFAAQGRTTDEIATELGISTRTVQYHFDSIRTKLRANNRQEAIAMAVQAKIISIQ
jgi:DNA-binding CsgD family transcriptional regulator